MADTKYQSSGQPYINGQPQVPNAPPYGQSQGTFAQPYAQPQIPYAQPYPQQPQQPYTQQPFMPYNGVQPQYPPAPYNGAPIVQMQPQFTSSVPMQPLSYNPHKITDPYFLAKLDTNYNYELRQGNALLEAVTFGVAANVYVICDKNRPIPIQGKPESVIGTPLYVVDEKSECCCRCCFPGMQSFKAKVWHATETAHAGNTECGCCYTGHKYPARYDLPPVMTLEREGCFSQGFCQSKWLGCFICNECCQDDMYMHIGDWNGKPGETTPESDNFFGRSFVPLDVCFIPQIALASKDKPGVIASTFAYLEGPCGFAGLKGLCCGDDFTLSREKGKLADLGMVKKPVPNKCTEWLVRCCTHVDRYDILFSPEGFRTLTPEQKAIALGNVVHLDYMFFENDAPPIICEKMGDKGCMLKLTLFQCFCKGCVLPFQIIIPCQSQS